MPPIFKTNSSRKIHHWSTCSLRFSSPELIELCKNRQELQSRPGTYLPTYSSICNFFLQMVHLPAIIAPLYKVYTRFTYLLQPTLHTNYYNHNHLLYADFVHHHVLFVSVCLDMKLSYKIQHHY